MSQYLIEQGSSDFKKTKVERKSQSKVQREAGREEDGVVSRSVFSAIMMAQIYTSAPAIFKGSSLNECAGK